jgi:hypothetical protein
MQNQFEGEVEGRRRLKSYSNKQTAFSHSGTKEHNQSLISFFSLSPFLFQSFVLNSLHFQNAFDIKQNETLKSSN